MNNKINLGYIHISSYKEDSDLVEVYDDCGEERRNQQLKEKQECNPNETILDKNKEYELSIDYPVNNPYKVKISTGKNGLTRRNVVSLICKHYKKMYKEEDESTRIPAGNIPGMWNRVETNGKYGIWGHDLGDLILHTLYIKGNKLEIGCDS